MEQEMEAQQATFGTFNLAAEKVAENLEENSPGVTDIQEKMEEFNDRWNKITTEVSSRIALVRINSGTYLIVLQKSLFVLILQILLFFQYFFFKFSTVQSILNWFLTTSFPGTLIRNPRVSHLPNERPWELGWVSD